MPNENPSTETEGKYVLAYEERMGIRGQVNSHHQELPLSAQTLEEAQIEADAKWEEMQDENPTRFTERNNLHHQICNARLRFVEELGRIG